jgi:hypothetical protein
MIMIAIVVARTMVKGCPNRNTCPERLPCHKDKVVFQNYRDPILKKIHVGWRVDNTVLKTRNGHAETCHYTKENKLEQGTSSGQQSEDCSTQPLLWLLLLLLFPVVMVANGRNRGQ